MYAFLPSAPLLSGGNATFHTCNTPIIRQPVHRHRRRERANVSMWTMDDLPESLRIPDRPRIGFSDYSEKLNGRLAMIGFVAAVVIELITGQGIVPLFTALLGN